MPSLALPGPKYTNGEFGYDVSLYDCLNGTFAEGWLDEKPVVGRSRLGSRPSFGPHGQELRPEAERTLSTYDYNIDFGGSGKRLHLYSPGQNVVLCGNFDVVGFDMVPGFPHTGVWTDALSGDTHRVTSGVLLYFGSAPRWMDTPVTPVAEDAPLALSSSTVGTISP